MGTNKLGASCLKMEEDPASEK